MVAFTNSVGILLIQWSLCFSVEIYSRIAGSADNGLPLAEEAETVPGHRPMVVVSFVPCSAHSQAGSTVVSPLVMPGQ